MNHTHEAVADLVIQAYNVGLLQHNHLTVCGLTVTLTIRTTFNILVAETYNRKLSLHVYDSDTQELQESTIRSLVIDMFN